MTNNKQTAVFNSENSIPKKAITALYSRLSNEDALDGQSGSISNQMEILEEYAKSQGFTNIVHFCDDGDTGVRFDRDAWQELMTEVNAGNVRQIILKDMTRWGRNYLEVGNYMDENVKLRLKKYRIFSQEIYRICSANRKQADGISHLPVFCLLIREILKLPLYFQAVIREHKNLFNKSVHNVADCCRFAHCFFCCRNDFVLRFFVAVELPQ